MTSKSYSKSTKMSSTKVLHQAVIDQDVATAKRIVKEQGRWRRRGNDGETVLHLAFKCKHNILFHQESIVEILECFINKGLSIDSKNAAGQTVLFTSVQNRLQYVTDFLVKRGANVDALDQNGNSIVHLWIEEHSKNYFFRGPTVQEFIEQEQIDSLTWLLSTGVSVHLRNNDGKSAFNLAIQENLKHILPTLIKHMKDVDYIVKDGRTILESFFQKKASIYTEYDVQILESLLVFVDCIDSRGYTLVLDFLRSSKSDPEILLKMLERYKNVNARDNNGNTALHLVSSWGQYKEHAVDAVRTLLSNGANVNLKNNGGITAFRLAVSIKHVEVLNALVEYGADASPATNPGDLLLHKFSSVPSIQDQVWAPMIDTLVRAGWNVNDVRPVDGFTPLMEACRSRCPAIAQKLIDNGANVNYVRKEGLIQAIHVVMMCRSYPVANIDTFFKMLAKAGANVNAQNERGQTALHLVPICGYATMKKLLKMGARVDAKDNEGRLPLHEAIMKSDSGATKALLEFGAEVNDVVSELKNDVRTVQGKIVAPESGAVDYVTEHWLRLKAANLPVIDGLEDLAKKNSLQEFYVECLREVETMKTHHLNDRITLYDVLRMDVNLKYTFIAKRLKELIESPLLKTTFPKYRLLIIGYYHKATKRRSLIELAERAWDHLTGIRLPDCVEKILTYLNNEDLRVMTEEEAKVICFKRPSLLTLDKPTKRKRSKQVFG